MIKRLQQTHWIVFLILLFIVGSFLVAFPAIKADVPNTTTYNAQITIVNATPTPKLAKIYYKKFDGRFGEVWGDNEPLTVGTPVTHTLLNIPNLVYTAFYIDAYYCPEGMETCALAEAKPVTSGEIKFEVTDVDGTTQTITDTTENGRTVSMMAPQKKLTTATDIYNDGLTKSEADAVSAQDRPLQFTISDLLLGVGGQENILKKGVKTLANLGINTAEIVDFPGLENKVALESYRTGITHFKKAIYRPPAYFSWDLDNFARLAQEAKKQADQQTSRGMPVDQTAVFHTMDEPGWYFPSFIGLMSNSPEKLQKYRNYLKDKGLTPEELKPGAGEDWTQINPVQLSQATTLPTKKLYYYTIEYFSYTHNELLSGWSTELKKVFNTNMKIAANWNNRVSWHFTPSPNRKIANNPDVNADSAFGAPDWFSVGKDGGLSMLWSEDWFGDKIGGFWNILGGALRNASKLGPDSFGGYIVGLRLGADDAGGKYKAFSLIGQGAKTIDWYAYGPSALFPGNGYSGNEKAYKLIADANRLIGRSEDLVYPGKPSEARVAIAFSQSNQMWHEIENYKPTLTAMYGIYMALTHSNIPVDFIDERSIASGDLAAKQYQALYVVDQTMRADAQNKIKDWANDGGKAFFTSDSVQTDEYNEPSSILETLKSSSTNLDKAKAIKYFTEFEKNNWNEDAKTHITGLLTPLNIIKPVSTNSDTIEAHRLDSEYGSAIVLLNKQGNPVNNVTVTIKDIATPIRVTSATTGQAVANEYADSTLSATLQVKDVDVLMVYTKEPKPAAELRAAIINRTDTGANVSLTWKSKNGTTCVVDQGIDNLDTCVSGEKTTAITGNTTYTMTVTGPGGTTTATASVILDPTDVTPVKSACLQLPTNNPLRSMPFSIKIRNNQNALMAELTNQRADAEGKLIITDPEIINKLSDSEIYSVRIKARGFLGKKVPNISSLLSVCNTVLDNQSLIIGDFNDNNEIDLLDLARAVNHYNGRSSDDIINQVYSSKGGVLTLLDLARLVYNYNEVSRGED